MAISRTDSGGSASKNDLIGSLAAIEKRLKSAQAAYDAAVKNKESSVIINKAKTALDNANKAYAFSQPLRNDLAAAENKKAYALSPAGIAAANAAYDLANKPTPTPITLTPKGSTDTPAAPTGGKGFTSSGTSKTSVSKTTVIPKPIAQPTAQFDPNKSPGKAWIWDGKKWTKPPLPSKGKVYTWNDETGYQLKSEVTPKEILPGVSTGSMEGDELNKKAGAEAAVTAAKSVGIPTGAGVGAGAGANEDRIYTADDGTQFTDQQAFVAYQIELTTRRQAREAIAAEDLSKRTSAYDLLKNEFAAYGMEDLVESVKEFIMAGVSPSEFTMRLRETAPYRERFKANEGRIKAGLAAISEAEYIGLEDQYQNVMRNYGLPESYYTKGKYGNQVGFQKFIESDVSATELEDRIMTAQERVINSNPEVLASLKAFYPGINNGDILAYTLDPKNALTEIKRKVTAAEIGGAAMQAGLKTDLERAQELGSAGITKAVAQEGFEKVAGGAPRGGQLASIYGQNPYTQATAETEVFGLGGKTEAATQRKKITGLEKATFSGQSGVTSTALVRDKAGSY